MYIKFWEGFPIFHAVFAFIVSASQFRVGLATSFDSIKHNTNIDVGSTDIDAATTDANQPIGDREMTHSDSSKKQKTKQKTHCCIKEKKACLEYFLAL